MSEEAESPQVECQPAPFCQFMEVSGDPDFPALSGMLLGIATNLSPFTQGAGTHEGPPVAPYYSVDVATREIRATATGLMSMRGNNFEITPLVRVAKDRLSVQATVHAVDYKGAAMPPIVYQRAMRDLKVTLPIDLKALTEAIERARETGVAQEIVLCAGRSPKNGRNGRLERLLEERDAIGKEYEDGSIDFRDRGAHPNVEEGTPVARYYPATQGERGMDVFGTEIPARDGADRPVRTGDNIREVAQEDSSILYEATARGLVDVGKGAVSVSQVLHIDGDVDMTTGNIIVETGSAHIKGSIRSGFSVTVADHLVVNGTLESAMVTCGGDVEVRGGIAMEGKNLVHAGGTIKAAYAQDAVLEADGDVIINGGIINSFITSKGMVIAERGKGLVLGGSVIAARGIDILESGSEAGTQTALTIALDIPELDALNREQDAVRAKLQRLEPWLGSGTPRAVLLRTPEPDRRIVAEVLKLRSRLEERLNEIHKELSKIKALNNHALSRAPISIRKNAHPGTRIKIGDRAMRLDKTAIAMRYQWDPQERQIQEHDLV